MTGPVESACVVARGGLEKIVGHRLSPGDVAAAPALVARLQGLRHKQPGIALDPKSRALAGAIAGATDLARQWGGVLVIGPGDRAKAERLGREVIAAIGAVNTAAEAAGLGACAIPVG